MLLAVSCSRAGSGGGVVSGEDGTQWRRMTVERLPDMNEPRGNHRTVVIGDEIVVLGGHTEGFKLIETAEYFVDGVWHTVPMLYPHLNGFAAQLQDGSILLGGGSAEAFGIGQSWGAEIYDPASHSFSAAGIMSAKRAMPSAVTLPDGKVVIVGNWHAPDSYEFWSAEGGFAPGGLLSPGWAEPFVLPASQDDIIVFGPCDTVGNSPAGRVDHLGGEAVYLPRNLEIGELVAVPEAALSHGHYVGARMQLGDLASLEAVVAVRAQTVGQIEGRDLGAVGMPRHLLGGLPFVHTSETGYGQFPVAVVIPGELLPAGTPVGVRIVRRTHSEYHGDSRHRYDGEYEPEIHFPHVSASLRIEAEPQLRRLSPVP